MTISITIINNIVNIWMVYLHYEHPINNIYPIYQYYIYDIYIKSILNLCRGTSDISLLQYYVVRAVHVNISISTISNCNVSITANFPKRLSIKAHGG